MTFGAARAGLLLLCVLTAGCASMKPPTVPLGLEMRQPYSEIDLGGRLSVKYQRDGKDEAIHGSFLWSQHGSHTRVTLLSPLGQTLAVIDIEPGAATLTQAGQAIRRAADPNQLAAEALGWPLPVAGLRDWLQGNAIIDSGKRVQASPSRADEIITADGWRLQYPVWDTAGPGMPHPKRVDVARTTSEAGEVALKIVIDSWQPL